MQPMLSIAVRAAERAGNFIERESINVDRLTIEEKAPNDFVSEIDRKAEAMIIDALRKTYPEHGFIGEESGASNAEAEYVWIIDPLDGTTNFVRGIPHYSVSIACSHKGKIIHGLVHDPIRRETFSASRGEGAFVNGRRMRVSKAKSIDGALLGTGIPFSNRKEEYIAPYMATLAELLPNTAGVRRAGSAALDLAYVASGRFDAFWEVGLSKWDIAAGILLITEAGGLVSDFKGGASYMETGNVVAGSPKVFKAVLKTVNNHFSIA